MAIVAIDGFDTYNGGGTGTGMQSRWVNASGTPSMVAGRFGGQAFATPTTNTSAAAQLVLPSSYASVSAGFALRVTDTPGATATPNPMLSFLSGSTYQVGMRVTDQLALEVYRLTAVNAGTSLGASASNVLILNSWHYVEVEITISDTVGVFKVYVDGTLVINLTAQDTRNGTPTTVDTIRLGKHNGVSGSGIFQIDDLYVTDTATKLGERRIETLYPTSDVAQGWGRSSGSTNYTLVDEAQVNGDTDYVQASVVGDVDTYGLGDLSSTPTTIDAVQVIGYGLKTDAAARSIALQVKSGATTSDGSNYTLTSTYGRFTRLLTTDPNTAAAWTATNVNALQGGPKVTV